MLIANGNLQMMKNKSLLVILVGGKLYHTYGDVRKGFIKFDALTPMSSSLQEP